MVIDHLFVCVATGAPEAEHLIASGLREGSPNVHKGQGTANRRFFFDNFMLELLWVNDPSAVLLDEGVAKTQLVTRCEMRDACPFGVCLIPRDLDSPVPFASWPYSPPYARAVKIDVASDAGLDEPMWFYFDSVTPREMREMREREPREHPAGMREFTAMRLMSPVAPVSDAAGEIQSRGLIEFASGPEYVAELTFDGGVAGKRIDLRPGLPLTIQW